MSNEAATGAPPIRFELVGKVCDTRAAWRLLGDTDWLNRVGKNGRLLEMTLSTERPGYPCAVGGFAGPLGSRASFVEPSTSWVHHRSFRQDRMWQGVPYSRTIYEVELTPEGAGVRPHLRLSLFPTSRLIAPVLRLRVRALRKAWARELSRLPAPGATGELAIADRELPPPVARTLRRWAEQPLPEGLATHLRHHLKTASPVELQQLRPFVLADRWQTDRQETLVGLLRGIPTGLFELYWSVRCPLCRGQVAAERELSNLSEHVGCPSCRIDFTTDLADSVEAVLAPHPALHLRADERFCTMFPSASPAMHSVFVLAPGAEEQASVPLEAGLWQISIGALASASTLVVVEHPGAPAEWTWRLSESPGEVRLQAGDVDLRLVNDTEEWVRAVITRLDTADDRVTGLRLATLPGFRRLVGHQALSRGSSLAVRAVAVVFSDLEASVAYYRRVGDAVAFGLVSEHTRRFTQVVSRHDGVLVKTIGDAVMASFARAEDATAAALAMMATHEELRVERGPETPRVRLGVNAGPALAVRTDASGIDFFGMTVNVAARAQGAAHGGEIVWTEAVARRPEVQAVFREAGIEPEAFDAPMRGIDGAVRLFRWRAADRAADRAVAAEPPVVPAPEGV